MIGPFSTLSNSNDEGNVGCLEVIDIYYNDLTGTYSVEFNYLTSSFQ